MIASLKKRFGIGATPVVKSSTGGVSNYLSQRSASRVKIANAILKSRRVPQNLPKAVRARIELMLTRKSRGETIPVSAIVKELKKAKLQE